jgi:hypothetical protein
MPFESLQVPIDGQLRPLLSRVRMRYAPTASLAYAPLAAAKRTGHTAVVTGKLFPRDEPAVAQRGFEHLAAALPGAAALRGPLPGPSAVYSTLFDRLVVFDDLQTAGGGAFDWAPVPLERNKPNNALGDWLSLPWGGPAEVILPGFHTAAEDSLKSLNRAAPGHEMFLSVCGLMSCGARTILLSRWRTGGQTSYQLVREFAQELPHTTAADAWQRAVLVTAGTRLDLAGEPRIKGAATDEPPKANHPFFWAGYLLVDTGPAPTRPDEPAEEPVLKLKPPEPIGPPAPPGDNAPPPDVQPAPPDPKPDPKPQPPAERPKPGDKKPKPAKR